MNKYQTAQAIIARGYRFEDRSTGIHGFRWGQLKVRKLGDGTVYIERSPKARDFRREKQPNVPWWRVYDPLTQEGLRIPTEIYLMCVAAEELVNRRYDETAPCEGPMH